MKTSQLGQFALGVCAAIAMLPGCSGSQMQIPSGATPSVAPSAQRNGAMGVHPDHGRSWMAPEAKRDVLLYISDIDTFDVYVYAYPKGQLLGTLTGFNGPEGECVDKTGNVFVANYAASNILEFAHGGTSPIATLSDPGYFPGGCSIDPMTGNLAVINYTTTGGGQGNVAIYKHAKDGPVYDADPSISEVYFGGYDNAGNLFVDGLTPGNAFAFAELPSGGRSFKKIKLNRYIGFPGGIQWDGTHVAVGDPIRNVIHQFAISGTKGTQAGSTPLVDASEVNQFWIEGAKVTGVDPRSANAMFWSYPAGGSPTKTITGLTEPVGVTVSKGK
jgi:hypothetical protein